MAQKVRVLNLNSHPLNEIFKGEEVSLAPHDYWRDKKGNIKELDIYEANDFRGQYHPVPFDGSGKMINDPRSFKMLKMEPVDDPTPIDTAPIYKCMAPGCVHISPSSEELEAHTAVRHNNMDKLILPEEDARAKLKSKQAKS